MLDERTRTCWVIFQPICSSSRRVSSIYFASFRFQHGEGNSTIQHWTWLTILVRKVTACSYFRSHPHPYSETITDYCQYFLAKPVFFFLVKIPPLFGGQVLKSRTAGLCHIFAPHFHGLVLTASFGLRFDFFSGQTASKGQRSSFFQSFSAARIPAFSLPNTSNFRLVKSRISVKSQFFM